MGRPERPLAAQDGPVQSFAAGLRELRRSCGNPTYRALAKQAHYSHTVITDAARGERLPTLAVTLGFVTACGGDTGEWRARWHLCRQQIGGMPAATGRDPDSTDPDGGDNGLAVVQPMPRWTRGRVRLIRRVVAGCGVVLLALAEGAIVWHIAAHHAQLQVADATSVPVTDGTDPKIAGCGQDAVVLGQSEIRLPVALVLDGRQLPAGTDIGTVSLRYSARCAGAWARFDPAADVYGDNPEVAAIVLGISRPADGTASTFRLPHVDEAYSDLLLTGLGCVTANATVELLGQPVTASAQTRCLPSLSG